MGDSIITLGILLLACGIISEPVMIPEDNAVTTTSAAPTVLVCVNAQSDGNYTQALSCINGKRMAGCCVDRISCNFNTSSIDLTMYGPQGYRSACDNIYVCCPLQFVIPVIIKPNQPDSDEDLSNEEFDDTITDDDV